MFLMTMTLPIDVKILELLKKQVRFSQNFAKRGRLVKDMVTITKTYCSNNFNDYNSVN